jgi:hypothetical protein
MTSLTIAGCRVFRVEGGLCPRNRILGGGFGRGAKPPSELNAPEELARAREMLGALDPRHQG